METFHQNLHELSNWISADTLDNLKYLCQDALSEAKLDSVKTPLDLFTALEEQGKISANNTEYLVELLRADGKPELEKVLVHGSLNVICEESSSTYSNTTQQLVYSQQYHSGIQLLCNNICECNYACVFCVHVCVFIQWQRIKKGISFYQTYNPISLICFCIGLCTWLLDNL